MTQNKELFMRLAILLKLADPTGKAINTPTFKQLSVEIVDELMNAENHPKYVKISREVEQEFKQAPVRTDAPAFLTGQNANVTPIAKNA